MLLLEETLKTPVCGQYDVVVAGCGVAGIAAALSAVRQGAKTLLLERGYVPGGLATAGLVTIYLPLCDGLGHQIAFGIAEELLRLSVIHGADGPLPDAWMNPGREADRVKSRYMAQFNPQWFMMEAERLLLDEGVTILYGAAVCGVRRENGRITHLLLETKAGRQAVEGAAFVDATGDADVCALAGERTVRFALGNSLAAWYYRVEDGTLALREQGLADSLELLQTAETIEGKMPADRFDGLNPSDLSRMVCLSRKWTREDLLGRIAEKPDCVPVTIPSIPQVRMTRRLQASHTLCQSDVRRDVSDCVGFFPDWSRVGVVYPLLLSSIQGVENRNLFAAGRCISADDVAWNAARAIPACAVSGEAAGLSAALAAAGAAGSDEVRRILFERNAMREPT